VPWLVLVFLLTAGAFGIPCMRPSICCHQENAAMDFAALLVACAAAFGCYALAAHVGEGRGPSELGCGGAVRARRHTAARTFAACCGTAGSNQT
jgi:hypothetical protein